MSAVVKDYFPELGIRGATLRVGPILSGQDPCRQSKKIDMHIHALSLYFVFYNFCPMHKSLRVTPAIAAGLSDTVRDMDWIVGLIEARAGPPKKRGPYKNRGCENDKAE
jgi:hypothetical protein